MKEHATTSLLLTDQIVLISQENIVHHHSEGKIFI